MTLAKDERRQDARCHSCAPSAKIPLTGSRGSGGSPPRATKSESGRPARRDGRNPNREDPPAPGPNSRDRHRRREQDEGGIIIPDTAEEKPQEGKVVALGKGKVMDDGKVQKFDVKKGDRVLFGKYAGTED